jgi:4-alpha-glucanotransferase
MDPPGCDPASTFDDRTRDAILQVLFASSSDLLILPIHDVFGWRERINTPALISERNWTWKLPWPVEELSAEPAARARAAFARALSERFDRGQG